MDSFARTDTAEVTKRALGSRRRPDSTRVLDGETRRVLVVDDDVEYAALVAELLIARGVHVDVAHSWASMLEWVAAHEYHLIVLDLRLPECLAIDRLAELVPRLPRTPVLIATSVNDVGMAVEAMRRGASSYVPKGLDCERIVDEIFRMLPPATATTSRAVRQTAQELGLIGESPRFLQALDTAVRYASSDEPVLIVGEPGTGKERFAHALHQLSDRRDEPFVAVSSGAVPAPMLEAQLFGHRDESGTLTRGLFAAAANGTLLLDEIGELPWSLQGKLYRAVRDGRYTPVGGDAPEPLTARLVATTHRRLEEAVLDGDFREELFRALAPLRLEVPPLREREGDVALLVRDCLDRCNARFGRHVAYPSPDVLARLVAHPWAGNVRELHHTIERAAALAVDGQLQLRNLFLESDVAPGRTGETPTYAEAKRDFEVDYLTQVLRSSQGNLAEAARRAGLHRPQLYRLMNRHGLGRKLD